MGPAEVSPAVRKFTSRLERPSSGGAPCVEVAETASMEHRAEQARLSSELKVAEQQVRAAARAQARAAVKSRAAG